MTETNQDEVKAGAETLLAFARLFKDNPRPGDAAIVLQELLKLGGVFSDVGLAHWIAKTDSPNGYEAAVIETNGKRWLALEIMKRAEVNEAGMLRLERMARYGQVDEDY